LKEKLCIFAFGLLVTASAYGQAPTGSVIGTVTDPSGAVVPIARVELRNKQTGFRRIVETIAIGEYSALALPPGSYEITVQATGFQKVNREVVVEAGVATTLNITLALEGVEQVVNVSAVTPQIRYDRFDISGIVTHGQVERLPLNGRNFLELAKLEPGAQQPTRGNNNRTLIPLVGAPNGGNAGARTRVTVDGGSIMAVGNGGAGMGLSQEVVQEFQVTTINFDLSTGMTASGAVNVVTRAGSNDFHGSAFLFFRDHHLSAYPGLVRDARNPNSFFQRRQFGVTAGGPLRKETAFFFATFERNEQRGVIGTELLTPDFSALSRITPSPTFVNQASVRSDFRLGKRNTTFLRYSHEDLFAYTTTPLRATGSGTPAVVGVGAGARALPSAWTRQPAWEDQVIFGLTSQLRPHLVNDLRFSYFFVSSSELAPTQADCAGCPGIGAPAISVNPDLFIGNSRTTRLLGRRFHFNDVVAWQRGLHRMRFGGDWELSRGGLIDTGDQPVTITLYSPQQVRDFNALPSTPPSAQIPLPSSFLALNDILQLPVFAFVVGIGDPQVPQANFGRTRVAPLVHLFFQDAWQILPRLTLNYGLGWIYSAEGNYDLRKPQYLAPLLGERGLAPTAKNWRSFSPSAGFAWSPWADGKTVIRGGAGIYYDYRQGTDPERVSLGPRGVGRGTYRSSGIASPITVGTIQAGNLLSVLARNPSLFSGDVLLQVLPTIRAQLEQRRGDPNNRDFSVTNIEVDKQGAITASHKPDTSAIHASIGLQRELARNFVVNADFVFRRFVHFSTGGGGFDFNHFNAARGPALPICLGAQRNDPKALCSLGPIQVFSPIGRGRYLGLLIRADKRLSSRLQFLTSYAYTSSVGTNFGNGFNNDARLASYGPVDRDVRHILNVSGFLELPRQFQIGFSVTYNSKPPFSAFLGSSTTGLDLNGDGTRGDLLPGTTVGQFNRGLDKEDLRRLVTAFNQNFAGKMAFLGGVIQPISLPATFEFEDGFITHDLRLSRDFRLGKRAKLTLIGEVFNLFNIANLSGFSGDLTNPSTFGQPNSRVTQVFGSGGPRSFQLAGRVSF
jgi:hypothetical protein